MHVANKPEQFPILSLIFKFKLITKLKKIVVDVEVGVTISKKNWAMVGVGDVFGYKIVVLLWLWVV